MRQISPIKMSLNLLRYFSLLAFPNLFINSWEISQLRFYFFVDANGSQVLLLWSHDAWRLIAHELSSTLSLVVMSDTKKSCRPGWSEKAKVMPIQQYIDNKDVLLGKFKGCSVARISFSEKENCWKRIV